MYGERASFFTKYKVGIFLLINLFSSNSVCAFKSVFYKTRLQLRSRGEMWLARFKRTLHIIYLLVVIIKDWKAAFNCFNFFFFNLRWIS